MSYSIKYNHQITFTFNGRTFTKTFVSHNPKPSDAMLNRIDGEIIKILSFGQW